MAGKINVIAGLGETGLSFARYLASRGESFVVMDGGPARNKVTALQSINPDARVIDFDRQVLTSAGAVYVSPGVPLARPELIAASNAGVPLYGDIALFGQLANAPVIGVTGTNGKSTVASLIHAAASEQMDGVYLGGNIGTPCLDVLSPEAALYVLEVSSYQMELAPNLATKIALVLNLAPDHLDRYASLDAYFETKLALYNNCEMAVVNRALESRIGLPTGKRLATFGWDEGSSAGHFYLRQEHDGYSFCHGRQTIMHSRNLRVAGRHNYLNVLAALAAGWLLEFDLQQMAESFAQFSGLPHRGQVIAEKNGVRYINDSKATNPGALIAAVTGQGQGCNIHLIAGGVSKGLSFEGLEAEIRDHAKGIYLIGEAQDQLSADLPNLDVERCGTLQSAVTAAHSQAEPGDIILLAPGCASFDEFQNFEARGKAFTSMVEELIA